MRNVTVAVVQMQCAKEVEANIAKADAMVREAAAHTSIARHNGGDYAIAEHRTR